MIHFSTNDGVSQPKAPEMITFVSDDDPNTREGARPERAGAFAVS